MAAWKLVRQALSEFHIPLEHNVFAQAYKAKVAQNK